MVRAQDAHIRVSDWPCPSEKSEEVVTACIGDASWGPTRTKDGDCRVCLKLRLNPGLVVPPKETMMCAKLPRLSVMKQSHCKRQRILVKHKCTNSEDSHLEWDQRSRDELEVQEP